MLLLLAMAASLGAAAPLGGDFSLQRVDGSTFSLEDARGKIVVLSFGYTSCPDVCPTTLAAVSAMMRALGPSAGQVAPLFVSVDPQRDSPRRLRDYLEYFHPAILGLTGSEQQLRQVARQYGTRFRTGDDPAGEDYEVDHSANLYIIDRDGTLVRIIPYGMPPSALADAVRALLQAPRADATGAR